MVGLVKSAMQKTNNANNVISLASRQSEAFQFAFSAGNDFVIEDSALRLAAKAG